MSACLEVWKGASCERVPLETEGPFTIGRHPDSDLLIADQSVSRLHATIEHVGSGWCLSDMSSNGTTVNGTRILGKQIAISAGSTIDIGGLSIVLRDTSEYVAEETITRTTSRPRITSAERRVLLALCRPLVTDRTIRQPASVSDMADDLVASKETVKFHLKNLYMKFDIPTAGLSRRGLLADAALRSGSVHLAELRDAND
jgi:predicted component of type VI protein secretion system